jgi:hypothetical protein
MEEEHDISSAFKKSNKPLVPEGFFENFYAGIKEEIDAMDAFAHLSIHKRKKPGAVVTAMRVPGSSVQPVRKRSRVFTLAVWSTISAVAASMAILFYINRGDEASAGTALSNQLSATTSAKPLENEMMDAYVAYLDEEELIDFIVENDISTSDNMNDDIYDLVESDIEDIYLDL